MDQNLKIVLGLSTKSDGELEDFTFSIIKSLTLSTGFPQPTAPTLQAFTANCSGF
jgi:hypothetical protein